MKIRQAALLGALHGPAELLPVSSSGHVTVVPWLLGWGDSELDDEARKSFEVALHAGSAAAWLLLPGVDKGRRLGGRDPRQLVLLALASAPAGAAGLLLERPIEVRLGTPGLIAAGLAIGGAVMAAADRASASRDVAEAGPVDAVWIGLAQASALLPGVSRTGASLAAARFRGFTPDAAWRLSAAVATPVIAGAAALKLARLLNRRPSRSQTAGLVAGAGASFGSTLLAGRVLRPTERGWPLTPFAVYRIALAVTITARLMSSRRASTAPPSRTPRV